MTREPQASRGAQRDPVPFRRSRLRGRDPELTAVRGAMEAVASGRSGIVLVQGLPGTGKSALLDEAVRLASPLGIRVARSSACAATFNRTPQACCLRRGL